MHPVTIGCCGWSYPDWKGHFYPPGTAAGDFLRVYSEHFPIVEVDSTYYAIPARRTVEGWRDKTPAGFRFSLKVPKIITHEKVLKNCELETDAFLAVAQLLGEKLLCCVLQFGYFNKTAFSDQGGFMARLAAYLRCWPPDVQLCVEVRNKAWLNTELANMLRDRGIVLVLTDQVWMPTPLEVVENMDGVTGPFGYVRLLGDRKAVDALTPTLDHIVIDRTAQMQRTAKAIGRISARIPVLAFINNHYAGYAIETARVFRKMVDELGARERG